MPVTRCTSAAETPRRSSASTRHSRESDGARKRASSVAREAGTASGPPCTTRPPGPINTSAKASSWLSVRAGMGACSPCLIPAAQPASTSSVGHQAGSSARNPAPACSRPRSALLRAEPNVRSMAMTSPVAFICEPRARSAPGNLSKGNRGSFTTT